MLYKKDRTRHKRRLYDLKVHKRWLEQATHPHEKEFLKSKIEKLEHLTGQVGDPPPPVVEISPEQRIEMHIDSYNKTIILIKISVEKILSGQYPTSQLTGTKEEIIKEFEELKESLIKKVSELERQLKT